MHFVEHSGHGTHFNISGYARTRSEKNPETALAFMEYLASPSVQRLYADSSKDYPVISGLKPHLVLQNLGEYKEDELPLAELSQYYELAELISKEEGWLWK
jgi:iron(III) transport system substrate-binding protein